MVLEDFNHSRAAAANTNFNSKLYECGYPRLPGGGDKVKPALEKQVNEGDLAVRQIKDSKETPEQRMDQKIKDHFGAEVFDNLKNWDKLIDNKKQLEDGFKKAGAQDAWDMARRMRDLSMVDGKSLIYLSKLDSATKGNVIEKRYDIYLRRGRFRSDDYVGQVSH